jgi:hypothetical protein
MLVQYQPARRNLTHRDAANSVPEGFGPGA